MKATIDKMYPVDHHYINSRHIICFTDNFRELQLRTHLQNLDKLQQCPGSVLQLAHQNRLVQVSETIFTYMQTHIQDTPNT